jgi:hypothetical protein
MPLGCPFVLSECPEDMEWTDPALESDGKKSLGGAAYNITSEKAFSKPFFGGLPYGVRSR